MKKIFVVLMSLVFVLGAFSMVIADDAGMDSVRAMAPGASVVLGGDAYVRGIWQQHYDGLDNDNDLRFFDQRVRLKIDAKAGDGIEARSRIVLLGDGSGNETQWDGANTNRSDASVDYSYLHVPVGSVTIDAGVYKRSFGNRLNIWDERNTTLQASMEFGTATVAAFLDKIDDTSVPAATAVTGDGNLDDRDRYGVSVISDVNGIALGAMIRAEQDNIKVVDGGTDDSGFDLDIYANAKLGNIDLEAELAYEGGDLNENQLCAGNVNCDGDAGMLLAVSASTPMNQLTLGGTVVYGASGITADDHFTPSTFVGTDQVSALFDFTATDDESAFGVVVSADYEVSADLSVGAKIAYYSFADQGTGTDDLTLTELDAGLAYQLGDNAQYVVDFAYGSPDKWTADDESPMYLGHALEMWF